MRTLVPALALSGMACLMWSSSASSQTQAQGADAAAGQQAFNNACRTCHTVKEGDNRQGPNLHKIIGRKAGSLTDYGYSSAMKEARLRLGRGQARAFHGKRRCGRARQHHEAVWRSRIGGRAGKDRCLFAVGHGRSITGGSPDIAALIRATRCSMEEIRKTEARGFTCGPLMTYIDLDEILPAVQMHRCCADFEETPMRTLALTILTLSIALAGGQARAPAYGPGFLRSPGL